MDQELQARVLWYPRDILPWCGRFPRISPGNWIFPMKEAWYNWRYYGLTRSSLFKWCWQDSDHVPACGVQTFACNGRLMVSAILTPCLECYTTDQIAKPDGAFTPLIIRSTDSVYSCKAISRAAWRQIGFSCIVMHNDALYNTPSLYERVFIPIKTSSSLLSLRQPP